MLSFLSATARLSMQLRTSAIALALTFGAVVQAQAQSAMQVGSFVKTTSTAPTAQAVPHGLGQAPKALILWTEGRPDSTFSNATGIAFRAAAQAGAASGVLTLTINKPAGTALNDVMIAAIGVSPNTATITAPANWTLVRRINNANNTRNALAVYRRAAGAGEPASYSWTLSASTGSAGGIASFSGVDLQTPIDVENGQATASALTHATPTVTTTGTSEMVVTVHTFASAATWTPPAGMAEAVDVASGALGAAGQSIEMNYVLQAAVGATGAKTATASANADRGNTEILTLRPAYPNYFGIGVSDGTTSGSISTSARHGVATAAEARRAANKALTIAKWDQTVLAEADLQSWDGTNFTLNWTTNDTQAYIVHFIAIGRSDISAKVVNWQMATTTGNKSVTGFGFQPTAVIHIHANSGLTGAPPSSGAAGGLGMGVMDFGGAQWATSTFQSPANPSDAQRGQQTNAAIFTFTNALAVAKKASFVSMDADGFTVNFTTANANAGQVFSLALRGVNVKAGSFLKSTGAQPASQPITGLGFQPQAVFLHSFQDVTQAAPVTQARLGYGASDGTTSGSSSLAEADAVTPTNAQGIDKTTKVFMKVNNATSTVDAEADMTSLDADGFTLNWTKNDAVATEMLYFALAPLAATQVRLLSFDATRYDRGTLLQWRTGYEVDNLGFNLYREVDGVRTRVNASLIGGTGLLAGRETAVSAEQSYARWDTDPAAGSATYWLEDLDFNGKSTLHGPITPVAGGLTAPPNLAPSRDLRDLGKRVKNKRVFVWDTVVPAQPGDRRAGRALLPDPLVTQQTIAGQPAVKIGVRAPGWYRVSQPDLVGAGLDPGADPRTLRLFVDGVEQAIRVTGVADGRFDAGDAVEFYGTGADTPYTDTRTYWLVGGADKGRRIATRRGVIGEEPPAASASFWSTVQRKDRSIYFAALLNGDVENWFGPLVSVDPTVLALPSDNLDPGPPGPAQLAVTLQGVTNDPSVNPDHRVGVLVNGIEVGEMTFDGRANATHLFTVPFSVLVDGGNEVTLVARGADGDYSLVDTIRLSYWHTYRADGDLLQSTVRATGRLTMGGFASPAIRVVDITKPDVPVELRGAVGPDGDGMSSVTLRVTGNGLRTLFAFTETTIGAPAFVRPNQPSDWHAAGQAHDYVVVSEATFIDQARPLAQLREQQGYRPALVDVEDVYDEFSFGEKSPQALKDFLQSARANWRTPPRFVVLLGDATIDPRDYAGLGGADFIPTKQVAMTAVSLETASDDWFVDFDDDGLPEIPIGRLSVRTSEQAAAVVSKIVGYDQAGAEPWTKSVLLVADQNDDTSDFEQFSNRLGALVPPSYTTNRLFRGDLGAAAAHESLVSQVNQGQLVVNFSGHGSVQIWGKAGDLLTSADVTASWRNASRLPLVVAMNCLNGLFDQVWDEESLAEALQRAPEGGAVAVWASSGITSSATQALVNEELFRLIFQGVYATIGEAVAAAKRAVSNRDLRRSWIFFGDPAMHLNGAPEPVSSPAQPSAARVRAAATAPVDGTQQTAAGMLATLAGRGEPIRLPDFNGDGRADVLTYAAESGRWAAAFSDGTGLALRAGQWAPDWQVVAADLNGDGRSDLAFYRPDTAAWVQAITTGVGTFEFTQGGWPEGATPGAQVRVGDVNGDHRDDLLIYSPDGGSLKVGLSDGRGGFLIRRGTLPSGLHVQVADLNGDGLSDVFGYDVATGHAIVGLSAQDGRFTLTPDNWGAGWRVTVANLDGRAGADLLFYDPVTGAWKAALHDGRPRVTPRTGAWAPGLELHAADLDADGRDDILGYNPTTGQWLTALNQPAGRFAIDGGSWTPGWSVATGDLNGDGRDDIVLLDPVTGISFRCVTLAPGVFAFGSQNWLPDAALVGRPR